VLIAYAVKIRMGLVATLYRVTTLASLTRTTTLPAGIVTSRGTPAVEGFGRVAIGFES